MICSAKAVLDCSFMDQYSNDDIKLISKNVGKILQKLGAQKGSKSKKETIC